MSTVVFDFLSFEGTKWFVAVDWPRPQRRSHWQTAGIRNPLQHFVFPASEAFPQISSFSCLCSTFICLIVQWSLTTSTTQTWTPDHPKHYDQLNHFLPGCPAKPNHPDHLATLTPLIKSLNTLTNPITLTQKKYYQLFRKTLFKIRTYKKSKKARSKILNIFV